LGDFTHIAFSNMPKFSQRYQHTPLEQVFQRETINPRLRTCLWNLLNLFIWEKWEPYHFGWSEVSLRINVLIHRIWLHYFKADLDDLPVFRHPHNKGAYEVLKDYFFKCKWYEVYDFIEFLAKSENAFIEEPVRKSINDVLETENSAYRLVGSEITEITDKNEIRAIEEALAHPEAAVRTHLEAALAMLADRNARDYRNSIKESISAVEAACRLHTGKTSATMVDALKSIKDLHPALLKGFSAIYGYTSDQSGIRHSLLDEPNITYADAKFMLAACAAFATFLKSKAAGT
jgi:hypothetical protein